MDDFEYILKLAGCETILDETKPSRLQTHLQKEKSFANLTSEINDPIYEPVEGDTDKIDAYKRKMKQKQSEINNKMLQELKNDIKHMGLSYIKTYGRWNDKGKQTSENSFLIPDISKEQALYLGKKYKQYGIIYKEKNDDTAYMLITLDNENFGKIDKKFDFSKPSKFQHIKEPTEKEKQKNSPNLRNNTGSTGLKKNGHGYQLKYYEIDEDPK